MRYGYRRVHVLLRREGWTANAKRIYRLYRELGLQLRNKVPKRRVKAKLREDRRRATAANETWAMDLHDQLATGRKIRILTVVDTYTRFSPALEPRFSFKPKTSSPCLSGWPASTGCQSRSGSTKGASSSRAISISGPTSAASFSTSPDPGSRRTMASSRA